MRPHPSRSPWYYAEPPSNAVIHASAIRLLTKIGAAAANGNRKPCSRSGGSDINQGLYLLRVVQVTMTAQEKKTLIGLRVRWQWPQTHMDQAPHTREFRIYYQPGNLNALLGKTQTVTVAGNESDVTTDITKSEPANSYTGCTLYVGDDAFVVVSSEAGTPLRLRVRERRTTLGYRAGGEYALHDRYAAGLCAGLASVANGSKVVTGDGTNWTTSLVNSLFQIATDDRTYRIASVESQTRLTLEEPYAGATQRRSR